MRYIPHTETNKLIRETLKHEFSGVKFGVKKSGSSTDVSWTADLTVNEVREAIIIFKGSSFDPMQDLETSNHIVTEGEAISYGCKYLFFGRQFPDSEIEKYANHFVTTHQWYDFDGKSLDTVPTYTVKNGQVEGARGEHYISKRDLNEMVWRTAQDYRTFADFMAYVKYERMYWEAFGMNRDFDKRLAEKVAEKESEVQSVWDTELDIVLLRENAEVQPIIKSRDDLTSLETLSLGDTFKAYKDIWKLHKVQEQTYKASPGKRYRIWVVKKNSKFLRTCLVREETGFKIDPLDLSRLDITVMDLESDDDRDHTKAIEDAVLGIVTLFRDNGIFSVFTKVFDKVEEARANGLSNDEIRGGWKGWTSGDPKVDEFILDMVHSCTEEQ